MRWEKIEPLQNPQNGEGVVGPGPGKRWGHTCNSIGDGRLLYVFGGYGRDNCPTNQVHIFDTAKRTWSEPLTRGIPPLPRESHSCTTVGDLLFIFGGANGSSSLNDLSILDTSSNTWISPNIRGQGPQARESHSAALIGKRLFIFGGSSKSSSTSDEELFNDVYILNTETYVWKRAETFGTPPSKRTSHTCSSWKNKLIVIGGEDSSDYYLSDVYILDTDTLLWETLNTSGQLLPPRGGHTTVALGKNMFVFGGFADEQNLFDDIYMLDVVTGCWTKVMAAGEGPSARFSMAGDALDPYKDGVLVFIGGCNKNLESLDDMYYLITGLAVDPDRDERRVEKLSLRKQLKLKCNEQQSLDPIHDKALVRVDTNITTYQPTAVINHIQPSRQNIYLHDYQTPPGKKTFQAKVTKSFPDGYTVETIIDGKLLRGVLFSNKPNSGRTADEDTVTKSDAVEVGGAKVNDDHNSKSESERSLKQDAMQGDGACRKSLSPNPQVPCDMNSSGSPNVNSENNETSNIPYSSAEDNTPAAATFINSPPEQVVRAWTAEEHSPLIEKSSGAGSLMSEGDRTMMSS